MLYESNWDTAVRNVDTEPITEQDLMIAVALLICLESTSSNLQVVLTQRVLGSCNLLLVEQLYAHW